MNVKKILLAILIFLPGFATAAGGETPIPLDDMEPNLEDQASLQRGAKTYLNYCMGCHSLKYQRYQRTAGDLGIPADLMMEHMVFEPSAQIGSLMENTMSVDNAKQWFGSIPPDLTLYTMLKGGPEYLYTYMRVFYEDETRPMGVNNLLYENVAMPHPLVELQGLQRKVCKKIPRLADNGGEMRDRLTGDPVMEEQCGNDLIQRGFSPLELLEGTGSLTPEEYDQLIYDLSNFLYYTADPSRLERERIGIYVLLFLAFFFVFTWLLGREYTKDQH
ncbi:cytochrome c1 [Gammaproteobacteria bacterium]|nr:cytochrome c1 [Gammaproteobacteria bacterium]